ncbi:MAG: menaquinone biosynthesis protein [Vicingus serpentipes]|nr:menaquinone biosynthesis protein [Vicingus serpentipes]
MKKLKVSAVSYLNTLPFIYGLKHYANIIDEMELGLDIPSDCANKLLTNTVDIGLVPVAILPQLKEYHIISDYCIGAQGKVNSVLLLSDFPLEEIEEIQLDYQSKTSVDLVQLLAKKYWKISPKWTPAEKGFESKIKDKVAGVIIGDRTFNLEKEYLYKYDLAEEWFDFTGLPFVFACWVSNKKIPAAFVLEFNKALEVGVNNINTLVEHYEGLKISKRDLQSYLKNDISYVLDKNKLTAIQLFLQYLEEETFANELS